MKKRPNASKNKKGLNRKQRMNRKGGKKKGLGAKNASLGERVKTALAGDKWPSAVDAALICTPTMEDKLDRAEGILELLINDPLGNLKFLDYGCGEGHVVFKSLNQSPEIAVGYDLEVPADPPVPWELPYDAMLLTTDMAKVESHAPYDVILLYDVLDHVDDPAELLRTVRELVSPNGQIIVRCHPYCGRHGGHQFQVVNKAFLHLTLTDEELTEIGITPIPEANQVFYPRATYKEWFEAANLTVQVENVNRQPVEPFFQNNRAVARRIMEKFGVNEFPEVQMQQSFVDYIVTAGPNSEDTGSSDDS